MRLILLWGMTLFILAAFGFGIYEADQKIRESMLAVYVNQQDAAVERVVRHMKEAYEKDTSPQKDASVLFTTYIQEEPSSSGAYWFLYLEDQILFERDAMQSAMLEGKDLKTLVNEWQSKGGKQTEKIMSLFQGKTKHLYFSKEAQGEMESVSVRTLTIDDRTYIVGCAATLTHIYQMSNYPNMRMYMYIGAGIGALVILLLVIKLHRSMKENKRIRVRQEEALHNYRAQVTRMEQELKERRRQVKDYQLMDSLSLFYNREYFYTLLLNMKRQNLKSLGMITIELANLHIYIDQYGLEFEQEVLVQIKDCLERCIIDENIIARVRDNRIVITIISDDYRQMSEECNVLEKALQALELPIPLKVYSMIQMPNESAMDMYRRVDQIISIS